MKVIFINLIFFIATTSAVDFTCVYKPYEKWNISYACQAEGFEITRKDDRSLNLVSNTHKNGRTNNDVTFFNVEEKIVRFFPQNLNKIFPNLETIRIYSSELKEVSNDDLKSFGVKLKSLWIDGNDIEKLEADLFVHNPKLTTLVIKDNQIQVVGEGFFKTIPELVYLDAFNNPCYSATVLGYSQVRKAGLAVEKRCKDFKEDFRKYLDEKINEVKKEIMEKCECKN